MQDTLLGQICVQCKEREGGEIRRGERERERGGGERGGREREEGGERARGGG
ncbi:unnamed protein product [Staurois parvus]|uniref:Uncharacterized protein n=1 Tax=Staurois parvus TaxID=386267 RepID=A0ABN9FTB9_9NEOB|nr:unnamed protein product [Staurois parvus]